MDEQQWLTCRYPVHLLAHLNRACGDRKLLLYAVACCRSNWDLLVRQESREAVEWAEGYADGVARMDEAAGSLEWRSEGIAFQLENAARSNMLDELMEEEVCISNLRGRIDSSGVFKRQVAFAYFANSLMSFDTLNPFDPTLHSHEHCLSENLLRDIFGNPFRPIEFSASWRTDTVLSLAKQMYDSRDFGAMPILADALQDAGCDNDDTLNHCRDANQVHVRGCWVVDLVLGKE